MKAKFEGERFFDEGLAIQDFSNEFLVVCPKCKSMAKVVSEETTSEKNKSLIIHKFICFCCHYREILQKKKAVINIYEDLSVQRDWHFRFPLWLQVSCCGENLWAYNLKHLEILEQYVSAKLRERNKKGRNSFLSKLPAWLKSAKNRKAILKSIEKLRSMANGLKVVKSETDVQKTTITNIK